MVPISQARRAERREEERAARAAFDRRVEQRLAKSNRAKAAYAALPRPVKPPFLPKAEQRDWERVQELCRQTARQTLARQAARERDAANSRPTVRTCVHDATSRQIAEAIDDLRLIEDV